MKSTPLLTSLLLAWTLTAQATPVEVENAPSDVIAEVGGQAITFSEINTMLNSSAVVGLSIPALGTPERDTVRITLLDRMISANLLYLDALEQGLDEHPDYRSKLDRFRDSMLTDQYYLRLAESIEVTDQEIQDFYDQNGLEDTELTDTAKTQIEAKLRTEKLHQRKAELMGQLRAEVPVETYTENLEPEGDQQRDPDALLATVGDEVITWGEAETALVAAGRAAVKRDPLAMEYTSRVNTLETLIDRHILAQQAQSQGLDQDPAYRKRLEEYAKTSLINLHRTRLAEGFEPDTETLQAYYQANLDQLMIPAARKVQEVVLGSREEASRVKASIENGDVTIWEAAAEYSIAPDAEKTLGEIGWVKENHALPAFNELIFSLDPDQIGGPVESPIGWHLIKVMDVRNARYDDIDDPATQQRVRRAYIHDKLDDYVVELRKHRYDVALYEDRMIRLAQQEADTIGRLAQQSQQEDSITHQRLQEFQRLMNGQER